MNFPAPRLYLRQVVVQLQAKPKARRAANGLFQTHGHFSRHARLAVDEARQRRTAYAKGLAASVTLTPSSSRQSRIRSPGWLGFFIAMICPPVLLDGSVLHEQKSEIFLYDLFVLD